MQQELGGRSFPRGTRNASRVWSQLSTATLAGRNSSSASLASVEVIRRRRSRESSLAMIAKMITTGIQCRTPGFMAIRLLKCRGGGSDGDGSGAGGRARVSFERWAAKKLKEDGPSSLPIIEEMRRSFPSGSPSNVPVDADAVESNRDDSLRKFQEFREEGEESTSLGSALEIQNIRVNVDTGYSDRLVGVLHESASIAVRDVGHESRARPRTFNDPDFQKLSTTRNALLSTPLASKEQTLYLKDVTGTNSSEDSEAHPFDASKPQPLLVRRKTKFPVEWNGKGGTVMLVDKPQGWTSFAVCAKLRYLLKIQKVGHAGTLDPMATGLLVVCLGKATKLAERYQAMTKVYSGTLRLGELTPSLDSDTEVSDFLPWEHITDDDLESAKHSFIGDILQTPPMFSAIKIKGERLYKKARRGEDVVEIPPRIVKVTELNLWRNPENRQEVCFRVTCSKGTYVRSLCADLARSVGSYGHLTSLRREKIGMFSVKDAWPIAEFVEKHGRL